MKLACLCNNVKIDVICLEDLEKPNLQLTPEERNHPFFSQDVYSVTSKLGEMKESFSSLIKGEVIGSWNIKQCCICHKYTHAVNCISGLNTFSSSLINGMHLIESQDSRSYSHAFKIWLPNNVKPISQAEESELLEDDIEIIKTIRDQGRLYLDTAEDQVRESIDSYASKQKLALKEVKEKVQIEEKMLLSLLKTKKDETSKKDLLRDTTNIEQISFPQSPLKSVQLGIEAKENNKNSKSPIKSFGLSLAGEINGKKKIHSFEPPSDPLAELLELDDGGPIEPAVDSDDDFIFPERRPALRSLPEEVARSAPINVPIWPMRSVSQQIHNEKDFKDGQDIAASMQEIARSVRGTHTENIFGDLPPPQLPRK